MRRRTFIGVMVCALALATIASRPFAATESRAQERALFRRGAKLWPVYCSRCHQAIPGAAYSPAQWDTIILHMRSRASLTGEDATAIMKYLQAR